MNHSDKKDSMAGTIKVETNESIKEAVCKFCHQPEEDKTALVFLDHLRPTKFFQKFYACRNNRISNLFFIYLFIHYDSMG